MRMDCTRFSKRSAAADSIPNLAISGMRSRAEIPAVRRTYARRHGRYWMKARCGLGRGLEPRSRPQPSTARRYPLTVALCPRPYPEPNTSARIQGIGDRLGRWADQPGYLLRRLDDHKRCVVPPPHG